MKHISDVLREERVRKGLSIEDVVVATKIRKNFITSIEEGKLNNLPSESYALGFVKSYASFLGIPESRASALFRREYEATHAENVPKFRKAISHSKNAFFFKSSKVIIIFIVSFIILSYIAYQFSFLVFGPKLEIQSPQNNSIAQSNIVVVSGKSDPAASVFINGEVVYVDLSGSFRKTLYIDDNQKTIEVVAKNRSGRETKKNITVQTE